MSDSRIPDVPLPRPYLRVLEDDHTTRDDLERVRKTMQQTIDTLQAELNRERDLTKKFEKSGTVLQQILEAPDFRALSMKTTQGAGAAEVQTPGVARVEEPPVEYVSVMEIELTEAIVTEKDLQAIGPK